MSGDDTTGAATPPVEKPSREQPFLDAKAERRDPVWARETEWNVRESLRNLRRTKVELESVQCASIRCTLKGTIDAQGILQEVVLALNKAGLRRGRFKRVREADGSTTFTGVIARKGYDLDGSPKAAATEPL